MSRWSLEQILDTWQQGCIYCITMQVTLIPFTTFPAGFQLAKSKARFTYEPRFFLMTGMIHLITAA